MDLKETKPDYDSPWKEALENYFPDFMLLLFPKVHTQIDWNQPLEFLNTELQKIISSADSSRNYADKLVKVMMLDGEETWVLIHIEIQGKASENFNERMYRYHYRLTDHFPNRKIASFAILTNQNNTQNLGNYKKSLWGSELNFKFPVMNLQKEWENKRAELEAMTNPFSVIILAQLTAHNSDNDEQRYASKFKIIKLLYQRGYDKKNIKELFRLIDWMLRLPDALELKLSFKINEIEETLNMSYITSIEAIGEARGEAIGEAKGEVKTLLTLLKLKFGDLSNSIEQQVKTAEKNQLDLWVENILTAKSLESLLATTP